MSYCIAELELSRGKREVAVVHRRWISGESFYYPNFWRNKARLTEALKNGWNPEKAWLLYSGHIVGNRFYGTYEIADSYLSQAENGSDFSSSEGAVTGHASSLKKRKTATETNHRPSEGSGSDSEDDQRSSKRVSHGTAVLPQPPTFNFQSANNASTGNPCLVSVNYINEQSSQSSVLGDIPSSMDIAVNSSFHSTAMESFAPHNPTSSASGTLARNSSISLSGPSSAATSTVPCTGSPLTSAAGGSSSMFMFGSAPSPLAGSTPVHDFSFVDPTSSCIVNSGNLRGLSEKISTIERGQILLTAKTDMCLDLLRTLVQKQAISTPSVQTGIEIPISTVEEFDSMNLKISSDRDARTALIDQLSVKGGNTSNQVTYRVMSALLTDEVMQTFTMAGQRDGKRSFRDSMMLQCVCDAVRRTPKGSVATHKEIESAIEYWLKRAKSRLELQTRRLSKGAAQRSDESQLGE